MNKTSKHCDIPALHPRRSPLKKSKTHSLKRGQKLHLTTGQRKLPNVTLEELRPFFKQTIQCAAKEIGVSESTLKKRCRDLNIPRWPYRKVCDFSISNNQLKKVENALELLRKKLDGLYGQEYDFLKKRIEYLERVAKLIADDPTLIPRYSHLFDEKCTETPEPVYKTSISTQKSQNNLGNNNEKDHMTNVVSLLLLGDQRLHNK